MNKIPFDNIPKTYKKIYMGGASIMNLLVYFSLALPRFPYFPTFLVSEKGRFAWPIVSSGWLPPVLPFSLPFLSPPTSKACTYSFLQEKIIILWFFSSGKQSFKYIHVPHFVTHLFHCCLFPKHFGHIYFVFNQIFSFLWLGTVSFSSPMEPGT